MELVRDFVFQATFFSRVPARVVMQVLERFRLQGGLKHLYELIQESGSLIFDKEQEIVGENLFAIRLLQVGQNPAELQRQLSWLDARFNPTIETKSGELSFEHGGCIEKTSWGFNSSGHHLFGPRIEIQIMRLPVGQGYGQRVAIFTTGSSDTLKIVGLRWAERNRESMKTSPQYLFPSPASACRKADLDRPAADPSPLV